MTTPKPPTPQPTPQGPSTSGSATADPSPTTTPNDDTPAGRATPSTTDSADSSVGAATSSSSSSSPSSSSSSPNSTSTSSSTPEPSISTSIAEPTQDPDRPEDPGPAALFDALAAEHAAIYGYGLVSAHVMPDENELVSESLAQHRDRREAAVALTNEQSVKAPLPAAGYQLPMVVSNAKNAAKLAVRLETDCAMAWRAVLEQTDTDKNREFGTTALTQCAVLAARWRAVLGAWPVTEAFPGGNE